MRSRSASMSGSYNDLKFNSDAESDNAHNQQSVNQVDHSVVTNRGAPARHSLRERHAWNKAADTPRNGKTGSKGRSTSRH
ncbi:uncharacterized protein N7529_008172 [Penicillium soppii]|uniref:uncharacterized protein n=1 Tax=Penicillium soppii TaxID=69789 RepID=UPI0025495A54|nr:uncharacterized protein N7529_008172 [Penicillium soppii]KAJ5860862.1 hypothetical protein N7529_008172 [Penicillium soppii]